MQSSSVLSTMWKLVFATATNKDLPQLYGTKVIELKSNIILVTSTGLIQNRGNGITDYFRCDAAVGAIYYFCLV
jgi:hypothetical protein